MFVAPSSDLTQDTAVTMSEAKNDHSILVQATVISGITGPNRLSGGPFRWIAAYSRFRFLSVLSHPLSAEGDWPALRQPARCFSSMPRSFMGADRPVSDRRRRRSFPGAVRRR